MGLINLISGSDIESSKVLDNIQKELRRHKEFIYITATANIKDIRQNQFKELNESNIYTFMDFQKYISRKVLEEEAFITTSDQRYILSRIIEIDKKLDSKTKKALLNMRYDLYELYKFLMFYNKNSISEEILDLIEGDFSITEKQLFYLYNEFSLTLEKIIKGIRQGNLNEQKIDKSILNLFKETEKKDKIDLYLNSVKSKIDSTINEKETVFMDGFLFFDDIQKYVIASAVKHGKKTNLVAKYSTSDQTNSFLFEDNYLKLSKELGHEINYPDIDEEYYEDDTALNYIKMKYPDIDMRVSPDLKSKLKDGSIVILKPFANRDKEL
ncbi:hypothetical protein RBH29_13460 [Herbivorax sp. ANBcel31]|uniref:hypothetical protein n=1 Tax=Herbivorax sp. ANBcel31 TaxID=3069754 RepID=UPI0027B550DC|nr:hypothetical protein [Herbivorax sp. ANBcel31]MDQ2087434.1 hypothetical protein [Herbivorax sp. ANBcel31]